MKQNAYDKVIQMIAIYLVAIKGSLLVHAESAH